MAIPNAQTAQGPGMSSMRNLKIVILTPDPERFRGALTLAAAQAVLGASVSIFLQLEAVALLRRPYGAPGDSAHKAKGLPTLAELMEDATALGVTFTLCQSGMDLTGLTVVDCDPAAIRSEEHTSELQSLMRISYAVFCLKKKK